MAPPHFPPAHQHTTNPTSPPQYTQFPGPTKTWGRHRTQKSSLFISLKQANKRTIRGRKYGLGWGFQRFSVIRCTLAWKLRLRVSSWWNRWFWEHLCNRFRHGSEQTRYMISPRLTANYYAPLQSSFAGLLRHSLLRASSQSWPWSGR